MGHFHLQAAYAYNAEGMIGELRHCSIQNGQSTLTAYRFEYDSLGRLVRSSESVGDTVKLRTEHIYDGYNRLSKQKWSANGSTYTEYYTYDDGASGDGSLKQFRTMSGQKINLTYDKLKRLQKSSITSNGGVEYYTVGQSYYTSGSKTTPRVEYYNYRMTGGALIAGDRYVYDALGNITEIQESEPASGSSVRRTKVRYTYDDQNQLKTETRYTYSSNTDTTGSPVTYTYTYDTAGNILSASDGTNTLNYTYGDSNWRDLLTAVGGTTISYDGSGNPTNWYNGTTSYSGLSWKNGRQLTQITSGGKTSYYTYDTDGVRSTKIVDGVKHEYLTLNGKVVYEKIGEGTSAKIMIFSYDEMGRPFAVKYSKNNGTKFTNYFYALNQQGDVVKIFRPVAVTDANGNTTGYTEKTYATYTYDAWGKLIGITNSAGTSIINKQTTSTALANLNPLRYRGYYYDNETGFYYLQSRYYDPAVGRFINADIYSSTGQGFVGTNMFAYCRNNPVNRTDSCGCMDISVIGIFEFLGESITELSQYFPLLALAVAGVHILSELSDTINGKTEEAIEKIKAYVDSADIKEYTANSVYVLRDSDNIVRYVGRTKNPDRRRREHGRDPLKKDYHMQVIATGMSRTHAIMFEQTLISAYSLDNLDNARREIALKNIPKFITYLASFRDIVCGIPEDIIRNILERR